MSLLHQVLQDIDQRQGNPAVMPGQLSMPVATAARNPLIPVLLVVCVVAVSGWLWSVRQSLSPALTQALPEEQALPAEQALPVLYPEVTFRAVDDNAAPAVNADVVGYTSAGEAPSPVVQAEGQVPDGAATNILIPEPPVPAVTEVIPTAPSSLPAADAASPKVADRTTPLAEKMTLGHTAVSDKPAMAGSHAAAEQTAAVSGISVQRSETPAQIAYRDALDSSKQGLFDQALRHIDRAINADPQPAYLALRLRILLEQKNSAGFIAFFGEYPQLQDVQWLSVAAPGLHMLGQPGLAIPVYQQLLVLQPDQVKWPLALAAAWEEENKPAPARTVLVNVLRHYPLSQAQQQWVERRIEVLSGKSGS